MGAQPQPPIQSTLLPQRHLAAISLAAFLYLVLADVAVETFLSGSPVRWWVAGAVVLYFALTAAVWRGLPAVWQRIGWPARASASFFVLLGLLTFTAWLPGGLTDGIKIFGQPTSRVLSLLTFAAIVLAGISLARTAWLPRWSKFAVGVVAAYGLAAFARGIVSGTSYPDLLHGESLWTRLPSWLQGAFVGALIVIPTGLLLRAAQMLKAATGASRTGTLRQVVAMAMTVLMAVSAVTNTGAFGPQPSAAEIVQPLAKSYQELQQALAGPKPKTPPTPEQVADRLDKIFPMLEQGARQIPRDTFDPQAVIDKVGKDPKKLFEWVRDNTYLVPYRGLLRGEKGVLMDRLGNSLDRAMLLYSLLQFIDQPARLARGTLTEAQAQDVLNKARPFPSFAERTVSAPYPAAADAFIKGHAEQDHASIAKIRQTLDQITAQELSVTKLVQKRVAAQAAMITAAIGRPPHSAAAAERAQQIRSVTDHWWAQWQNGGSWVDLDPTLPDSQPGQSLTNVQSTPTWTNPGDFDQDLLHTVTVTVVIEVWKDGQVREMPVLTQQLVPASIIGEPIVLRQIPVYWPQDLDLFQEKDPVERFKQTILQQTEWLPVLTVGSLNVSKYSFSDYGDLNDATLPTFAQSALAGRQVVHAEEESVQVLGGGIGGMLTNHKVGVTPQPTSQPKRAQVTAEWVDYEIHTPGEPTQKIRRDIFDILGFGARSGKGLSSWRINDDFISERAAAALSQTEILPLVSQISSDFMTHLIIDTLSAGRDVLLETLRKLDSSQPSFLSDQASKILPVPFHLYSLALSRQEWGQFANDVFLDRPNILSYRRRIALNEKGKMLLYEGFDIVSNEVGIAIRRGIDPFSVRIEHGVLDTNAESILLPGPSDGENTSDIFAISGSEDIKWRSIRASEDPAWKSVTVPINARGRILKDLASGYLVLLPVKSVRIEDHQRFGWWQIDPYSGRLLGMMESGQGQSATEYALKIGGVVTSTLVAYVTYVGCVGGLKRTNGWEGDIVPVKASKRKNVVCLLCGMFSFFITLLMFYAYFMPLIAFQGLQEAEIAALVKFLTGAPTFGIGTGAVIVCGLIGIHAD